MTHLRALALVVALALLAMGGIVGMLLTDLGWDQLFFVMSAAPLIAGACYWLRRSFNGDS